MEQPPGLAGLMRTNDELIRAVLGGQQVAFAELVRRYERTVWTTVWKVLRDHHAAEDATQNAFVEAYRQLGQLRHPAYFGVWLLRIAHREALRISRRRGPSQSLDAIGDVVESDVTSSVTGESGALLAAVGSLPDHERLVVTLRYLDGHSVADVAQLTGRPVGTVTKQLSRAIERLKSILTEVHT
jgi:RNA polymerase sigma-70 factor (ECF subfamily)